MAVARGNSRCRGWRFRSVESEGCTIATCLSPWPLPSRITLVAAAFFLAGFAPSTFAAEAAAARPAYPFGLILLAILFTCIIVLCVIVTAQRASLAAQRERIRESQARAADDLAALHAQIVSADARAAGFRSLLDLLSRTERPDSAPDSYDEFLSALKTALPGFEVGIATDGREPPPGIGVASHRIGCECELQGLLWVRRTDGRPPSPDDRQQLADFANAFMGFCDQSVRAHRAREVMTSLRERETQSRKLLDFIPVPIWLYSIDTLEFIRVNQAAIDRYGYARDEWAAMSIADVRPPEDIAAMHETQSRIRAQAEPLRFTCRHRTRAGEVIWVDVVDRPAPFVSADARLAIGFDVTPRENERRTLANRTEELARTNEQLDRFAAIAGHDLQEPLRMISSFAGLLESRLGERLDERERSYLDFVTDGASRMQRLLDDLLQYARAGSRALRVAPVDASMAARLAASHLRLEVEHAGATIHIGPLPRVAADESLLVIVFKNLFSNSLRYRADAPPRITVDARRVGDAWRFCVGDNGLGVPPEMRREVFQMFRRGAQRSGGSKGSGLGLSICQRVVERLCGSIWLEPGDQGAGLRVFFTLPAVSDEARPPAPEIIEPKQAADTPLATVSPSESERST